MQSSLTRTGFIVASVIVAALAVSQASARPKTPPPPPVLAPPPPPPPPPTTLSHTVVDAAAAYQGYVRQALELKTSFTSGADVQETMQKTAAYEPKALARDMVAYAAILALQDPNFVAGVKVYAKDPAGRQDMVNKIFSDPAWAAQMPGADSAAGLIVTKLNADGEALAKAGGQVKQSAYDIQREKWSKELVPNRDARLALAKQLSSLPAQGSSGDSAILMQAAISGQGMSLSPASAKPPYTETVIRGMAIAALAVLGAAGDENAAQVNALLDESTGPQCLTLGKLNLYQCLAVAKPHYEDVFCVGQHVLMDTGRCVQRVVGTAPHEEMFTERMAAKAAEEDARKAAAKAARASRASAKHGATKRKHK